MLRAGAAAQGRAGIRSYAGEAERDAFLARTDILVVLLPHTPATHGIINAGLLAKLAHDGRLGGPFLLNAGRGGLQVEADILAALDTACSKGHARRVRDRAPAASSPIWEHPNVTISPHNAATSEPEATARYIVGSDSAI